MRKDKLQGRLNQAKELMAKTSRDNEQKNVKAYFHSIKEVSDLKDQ